MGSKLLKVFLVNRLKKGVGEKAQTQLSNAEQKEMASKYRCANV